MKHSKWTLWSTLEGERNLVAAHRSRRQRARSGLASLEALEPRTLLASGHPAGTATLDASGTLTIAPVAKTTTVVNATSPTAVSVSITGSGLTPFSQTFTNPAVNAIVINETGASDTVQVTGTVNTTVNCGTGSTTIDVALLGSGSETYTINGNQQSDQLVVTGTSAQNNLGLSSSQVTLHNSQGGGAETVNYSQMSSLAITSTGVQVYAGAVVLATPTTLTAPTVSLSSSLDDSSSDTGSNNALTITGNTVFAGSVGRTTALPSLSVSGTAALNAALIATSGTQTYNGAVTVGAATNISGSTLAFGSTLDDSATDVNTGANAVTISGNVTFAGSVGSVAALPSLTVTGNTTLTAGSITTTGPQTYDGWLDFEVNPTIMSAGTAPALSTITFGSALHDAVSNGFPNLNIVANAVFDGQVTQLNQLSVAGTTAINTPNITTFAGQTYAGAVTLGATTNLSGTAVVFGSTLDDAASDASTGSNALTIAANATFDGLVGATNAVPSLTVNETTTLNTTAVTTTQGQNYNGAVTLGAASNLSGSTIAFRSTVDDSAGDTSAANTLTITGNATFAGLVGGAHALPSLTVTGTTALNAASVTTTQAQSYNGAMDFTVNSTTLSAGSVPSLATITFGAALHDSANTGTANLSILGNAVFDGPVSKMGQLSVSGTTTLNATSVTTSSSQTYSGAVTLGANTSLSATTVSFGSTIDDAAADASTGVNSLTITGNASFAGLVGSVYAVPSLTVNGTTTLNTASVKTAGTQTYNGAATVGRATNFLGSTVAFGSTFDDVATDTNGVNAVTITGNATFAGLVGSTYALPALTVTGITALSAGVITTVSSQLYGGAISFGSNPTTLIAGNAPSFSTITFGAALNGAAIGGAASLTIAANAVFDGSASNLTQLTVTGTSTFNGSDVTTSSTQTYNCAVTLGANANLSGSTVSFGSTINDATAGVDNLTINGNVTFGGPVGSAGALHLLTVNGTTGLNTGSVTTTGQQAYSGAVTVGPAINFTGSTIAFGSALDDANAGSSAVTITGNATFAGPVGSIGALPSLTVTGSTTLSAGSVTTTGAQTYGGTLDFRANPTTLIAGTAPAWSTVTFGSALHDGASTGTANLLISGNAVFGGPVSQLGSLEVQGTTRINAASITTSASQTYDAAVTLGASSTLSATAVTFDTKVDDAAAGTHSLTITGPANFEGAVGATAALGGLSVSGASTIGGGVVETAGAQDFAGAVTLNTNTTLDTTDAGTDPAGGALTVGSVAGNGFALTLNGGTSGAISGTSIANVSTLTIVNSAGTTFTGSVIASTATLANTTGTIAFEGNLTLGTLNTNAQGYAVAISGNTNSVTAATTFDNTGGVTLEGSTTFAAGLTSTASPTTTSGTIRTAGTPIAIAILDLSGDTALDTTGGGADPAEAALTLGTIDGASDLTLLAGSGAVALNGAVGSSTPVGNVTITTIGAINDSSTINSNGAVTFTNGGLLTMASGANISAASVAQNGAGAVSTAGNITTTGGSVSVASALTLTGPVTITSAGGAVNFNSAINGASGTNLTITAGAGNVTFASTIDGAFVLTVNSGGTTTFDGAVGGSSPLAQVITGTTGSIVINAPMSTGGDLTFNDPVYLTTDVTLTDAGPHSTGITFNNTIDSFDSITPRALTVVSNNPKIFNGNIGVQHPLSTFTTEVADPNQPAAPTQLNGITVVTIGNQNYTDNLQIGTNTNFDAGTTPVFGGSVTAPPGETVSLSIVATQNVDARNVDVPVTVHVVNTGSTTSNVTVHLGQDVNTVIKTVSDNVSETIYGGGAGSQNNYQVAPAANVSGGAGSSFSDGGRTVTTPVSNVTLIDQGGYNIIDVSGAPVGVTLNLNVNNGQQQSVYDQSLNNPNIENQGFSATFFSSLDLSTLSLQGSFQEVIGSNNDVLYTASANSSGTSGSSVILTGTGNTVYADPGSTVTSFSGDNQVIQTTNTTNEAQVTSYLQSVSTGQKAFTTANTTGIKAFLVGSTTGQKAFISGSATGIKGFLTSSTTGQKAFLTANLPGVTQYLSQSSTNLKSYLTQNLPGIKGFLSGSVTGIKGYLLQNGAAVAQTLLGTTQASQLAYLASNLSGVTAAIIADQATLSAYLNADAAGMAAYASGGATALQTYLMTDPVALQQFVTESLSDLSSYLNADPTVESAFVDHNQGPIAAYVLSTAAGVSAVLNQQTSGVISFIASDPTSQQLFLQQNAPGISAYILADPGRLNALFAGDSGALQAYTVGSNNGLTAYLETVPTDFQQYIASNSGVLSGYLSANTALLSTFTAANPTVLLQYLGNGSAASQAALQQSLSANPSQLTGYLASTTLLQQYAAESPDSVGQFLGLSTNTLVAACVNDPTLLQQFLTAASSDNASLLQAFLNDPNNAAVFLQFLNEDPGVVEQFLDTPAGTSALQTFLQQNPADLQQALDNAFLDLFRVKVNLQGSGNEVTGGLLVSFTLGGGSSVIESLDPGQLAMVESGVSLGIAPSAYALNATLGAGSNVVVAGLLSNITSLGGNTRFVIEDPGLLGLPSGTFSAAVTSAPANASPATTLIQSPSAGGIFTGGGGNDTFSFVGGTNYLSGGGNAFGHIVLNEPAATAGDTLDFSNFQAGGITANLNTLTEQTVSPNNLWVTLPNDAGVTNVIGSPATDTITGNNLNNTLDGASLDTSHPKDQPGPTNPSYQVQWVYLDFNDYYTNLSSYETLSQFDPGGVYATADQQAILQGLQNIYAPFSNLVKFTLTAPTTAQAPNGYETVFFNRTPISVPNTTSEPNSTPGKQAAPTGGTPQPGGISSQIDFRNLTLTDTVNLDVNAFLGTGTTQVSDTETDFQNLSITIAAHEVGHTLGQQHQDAFGPISFGITNPPGPNSFNPSYNGLVGAFQTDNNIMASPASVGSTLANAASGLINVGERSAIVFAFIQNGTTITGSTPSAQNQVSLNLNGASTPTSVSAQSVSPTGGLYTLNVPNPVNTGYDAGKAFDVAAIDITGQLPPGALVTNNGQQVYETNGDGSLAKDSQGNTIPLRQPTGNDYYTFYGQAGDEMNFQLMSTSLSRITHSFDSVLYVYGPDGKLAATNDDDFESSDSTVIDLTLNQTGTYTVEVSAFHANQATQSFFIDPTNTNYNPAAYYGTESGSYELFVYRFNAYNATSGNDTLIGGAGNDTIAGGSGNDTIILGPGSNQVNGGGGTNTVQISGAGSFGISSNQVTNPNGSIDTLANIQAATLTDTSTVGGNTFTIDPSWAGTVQVSGVSGLDGIAVTGTLNGPLTASSNIAALSVSNNVCASITLSGNLGSGSIGGNANSPISVGGNLGSLSVTGNLSSLQVGGSVTGTVSVGGNANTIAIGTAVANTAVIQATNINALTVGPNQFTAGDDMAGQVIVSSAGLLSDLRVAGGTPGTITAGKIGTLRVYGGYGPVVLQVSEGGIQRLVEATTPSAPYPVPQTPPSTAPTNPLPNVTFQEYYEGLGSLLAPASPQLTVRVNNTSTANDQFDLSLLTYNDQAKFNLARVDASANAANPNGVSGIRNVEVEGNVLSSVSQAASSFFGSSTPLAAGIALPKDTLAGVAVRDFIPNGSITAKSVQAVAFGQHTTTSGTIATGTGALATDAAKLLTTGTAIVPAGSLSTGKLETFAIPFADLNPVAFFFDSSGTAFNSYGVFLSIEDSGTYPGPTASNIARGADSALVGVLQTTSSAIQSVAIRGDNAALSTAQTIAQCLTSTGPLGDFTVQGPLAANVTVPSVFGSITVNGGGISGTIQTNGIATNPITGATSCIVADIGRVYLASGVNTVTTIQASGTGITGRIISGGNLISQINAMGGISGAVEAQGNIGTRPQAGSAVLGGITVNGTLNGTIVALGSLIGNTTINGAVQTVATNPLRGLIAVNGAIVGNITMNGLFSGEIVAMGCISGTVALNGPMMSGRVASEGGITGNLTVASLDANSAIVSDAGIGNASSTPATYLTVTGTNAGIIAAKGTINYKTKPAGYFFNNATGVNAAAIDAIFVSGGIPLTPADLFDQSSLFDLVLLKQIVANLKALAVITSGAQKGNL